jgi:hypothetical protein
LSLDVPLFGRRVEIEMIFRGLGEHKAEEVFKGMQLTLLWLNEVDTLSPRSAQLRLPARRPLSGGQGRRLHLVGRDRRLQRARGRQLDL